MSAIRNIFLLLIGVSVVIADEAMAAASEQPADLFKKFIESPPESGTAVFSQELPSLQTNYYVMRWQGSNLFVGTSKGGISDDRASESSNHSVWIGRYGNRFQLKADNGFYKWTNNGVALEEGNSAEAEYESAMHDQMAELLNMGCNLADVGSVRWKGDDFRIRNEDKELNLHGHLTRDSDGRAQKLIVEQEAIGAPKPGNSYFPWEYDYSYDNPLALSYLPSLITASFKDQNGNTPFKMLFRISAISILNERLPEDTFFLAPESKMVAVTISNNLRIYTLSNGMTYARIDEGLDRHFKPSTRQNYFIVAFLILAVFPIFLWYQKKASK